MRLNALNAFQAILGTESDISRPLRVLKAKSVQPWHSVSRGPSFSN